MNVRRARSHSYAVISSSNDVRLEEIAKSDIFHGVFGTEAFLSRLKCQRYRRRAIVFDQGDHADRVFVVRSGSILISRTSCEGRELSVDLVVAHQAFGEEAFFADATRVATATCTTDASIFSIDGAVLRSAAERCPTLAMNIARVVHQRLETVSSLVETIAFNTVADRIVRIFERLASRGGTEGRLGLELTHGDIATMVGSTRESVSTAIGSLVRSGRIALCDGRPSVVRSPQGDAAEAS